MRVFFTKSVVMILGMTLFSACGVSVSAILSTPATIPAPATLATSTPSNSMPEALASTLAAITVDTTSRVEQLVSLRGHSGRVTDLVFSPDGDHLASSSRDGTIRLWDVEKRQEVHAFSVNEADLNCIAFSPDGGQLASAEARWDVGTRQVVHTLERGLQAPGHVAFSPDGSLLAVALFNHPVRLWDVVGGQVVRDLDREADAVGYFGIGFSPDGARLAAGGLGGTVTWWEIASGEIGGTFEYGDESGVHDIAFSPDGRCSHRVAPIRSCDCGTQPAETCCKRCRSGTACIALPFRSTARCWPRPVSTARSSCGTSGAETGCVPCHMMMN